MTLLTVRNLYAGYGKAEVLHGVDLEVDKGEVLVVLGANGAGKTTTLRAISGMISATGSVELEGRNLVGSSSSAIAAAGIAHVPQGRGTFRDLSVEDNLLVGAYLRRKDRSVELERWYEVFPRLGERRRQLAGGLSGGEQQMLAIARAMMSRPKLLLLDEPSLGLAPKITQEVFEVLGQISREGDLAILVVEQNAQIALGIAQRAVLLEAGRVINAGRAEDIAANDSIRRAYLGY